jgi:divalent metal cation (Fe/Co/Zn/Cd) transporter
MCLTCGCEQAHLEMGDNITYEDLKRIADGNNKTVAETLDIIDRTVAIDRQSHKEEYAQNPTPSAT